MLLLKYWQIICYCKAVAVKILVILSKQLGMIQLVTELVLTLESLQVPRSISESYSTRCLYWQVCRQDYLPVLCFVSFLKVSKRSEHYNINYNAESRKNIPTFMLGRERERCKGKYEDTERHYLLITCDCSIYCLLVTLPLFFLCTN